MSKTKELKKLMGYAKRESSRQFWKPVSRASGFPFSANFGISSL